MVIGGSEEAVVKVKAMLPQTTGDKIMGTFQAEMFANSKEILEKAEPLLRSFEEKEEAETVNDLLTKAMKNENAVIGIENVLNALQEGRVMILVILKDYNNSVSPVRMRESDRTEYHPALTAKANAKADMVDLIAQKGVERGAIVEIVSGNKS
jgi:peptide subunit release factor 1 (eRF1)